VFLLEDEFIGNENDGNQERELDFSGIIGNSREFKLYDFYGNQSKKSKTTQKLFFFFFAIYRDLKS
jgi:hypothetical protein